MSIAVRERPILMSAPMVKAILSGAKTQTRRIVKPQPGGGFKSFGDLPTCDCHPFGFHDSERHYAFPYGQPGDRLWVRETHRYPVGLDAKSPSEIAESCLDANYRRPWAPIRYEADGATRERALLQDFGGAWGKTRVSIHMPRWASRLTLEITDVRVERLQDISAADAAAEGVEWNKGPFRCGHTNPTSAFRSLWESINGPGSWARNDYVWAISFRRAED